MLPVISVENISKQYRLGQVGTGTLSDDLTRLWCRLRGKEDPFLKIGQTNDRTKKFDGPVEAQKKEHFSRTSPDLVWALKDINFEVKEGEVLGIIGRNGAGKSTLLKILARVTTPTTGEIKVKGRIASLLEVGTGFNPDLSGRENIFLNGAILGMRKHEITRKLDEIIDFSGCDRYIDTPVKRYSSGMYVRLAFAVAAHLEPEILIVDEVLAVGDAEFQAKCLGKMRDVANGGRTVLFVSHNLAAVQSLTTRCLYLRNGCLCGVGETSRVLDQYLGDVGGGQTVVDGWVSDLPRPRADLGQDTRIVRVRPEYKGRDAFVFGTPLEFLVDVATDTPRSELRLGITLSELNGTPVMTMATPGVITLSQGGCRTCHITIDESRLAPGTYTISLSLGHGTMSEARTNYDVVNPGPPFVVSQVSEDQVAFNWMRAYGPICHTHCHVS